MTEQSVHSEHPAEPLPLRPDDLVAFRLGRLMLLLETVPGLPGHKPMDVERISLYDFFADNPFLVFDRDSVQHRQLVIAGFDSRNLSYQSSAQRFSSRRERLQHDLSILVSYALVEANPEARRVAYALTDEGRELAARHHSLYAQAYRESASIIGRELNKLSDRALHERTRSWLKADELMIDLFGPAPDAAEVIQ